VLITVWSVKGGSGCSVVCALLALDRAREEPVLLVDFDDDLAAILGAPPPEGPALADLVRLGVQIDAEAIAELAVEAAPGVHLIRAGRPGDRAAELAEMLSALPRTCIVDLGRLRGDAVSGRSERTALAARADSSLLVTRLCYLALRRSGELPVAPNGVVVLTEPGRALTVDCVEPAVGAPVLASVAVDPSIARAVDAGLLARRLPRSLLRSFEALR
jgi:hypothetical protein